MSKKSVILIGYSGHAFVACDIFASQAIDVKAYCDFKEKKHNPYNLAYLGVENSEEALDQILRSSYFVSVGDNRIRKKLSQFLFSKTKRKAITAIHNSAIISPLSKLENGVMIGPGGIVNSSSLVKTGVICNSQSVIEHDCEIGEYSHIGPGAVLCGNVTVGKNSFIGARTVVKEGVKIGNNVIVGAGTVVIRDIPDNFKVVGNPQRVI